MHVSLFFILMITMPLWMAVGVIGYFLRKEQGSIFYPTYDYSSKVLEPITTMEDGLILSPYENL